jgi:hypothetical protein
MHNAMSDSNNITVRHSNNITVRRMLAVVSGLVLTHSQATLPSATELGSAARENIIVPHDATITSIVVCNCTWPCSGGGHHWVTVRDLRG